MNGIRIGQLVIFLWSGFCAAGAWAQSVNDFRWVESWAAAADSAGPRLKPQTLRQVVRSSVAGSSLRVRLSNRFGKHPLIIGAVHIALRDTGSTIRTDSDHVITFNGNIRFSIAKGEDALSDPIPMNVGAMQELAISTFLPRGATAATMHTLGLQTVYTSTGRDATASNHLVKSKMTGRYFLTDVEVAGNDQAQAIVTIGDSITDGMGSAPDTNTRWSDLFAARLHANPAFASLSVVNTGIIGNRILQNGMGPSTVSRFDRDALNKPGVHWIVLEEGLNDIGWTADNPAKPSEQDSQASAQQVIAGLKTLIDRAHAKNIKMIAATLPPFKDSIYLQYSVANEQKRQEINQWIREAGAFDGVIDFDRAIHDPAQPDRILPAYDSGDHTHPNLAGYQAITDSIDLDLIKSGV